jgi:hypothetical protein
VIIGSWPAVAQLGAEGGGAAVLPDDGAAERAAGVAVPDEGGLALVGDADGEDVLRRDAAALDGALADRGGGRPEIVGVVLDPARAGVVLGELLLGGGDDPHRLVEQDRPGRGGALVDGEHVLHGLPPWSGGPLGGARVPS